jgi:hypothetical protein
VVRWVRAGPVVVRLPKFDDDFNNNDDFYLLFTVSVIISGCLLPMFTNGGKIYVYLITAQHGVCSGTYLGYRSSTFPYASSVSVSIPYAPGVPLILRQLVDMGWVGRRVHCLFF